MCPTHPPACQRYSSEQAPPWPVASSSRLSAVMGPGSLGMPISVQVGLISTGTGLPGACPVRCQVLARIQLEEVALAQLEGEVVEGPPPHVSFPHVALAQPAIHFGGAATLVIDLVQHRLSIGRCLQRPGNGIPA